MKKFISECCLWITIVSISVVIGLLVLLSIDCDVSTDFVLYTFMISVISYWIHSYLHYNIVMEEYDNKTPELDLQDFVDAMIAKDSEEKEIHFYKDYPHDVPDEVLLVTHNGTKWSINNSVKVIHTTALTMLSFDLLDLGYRIFLHENNKVLECKPGMDGTEKDVRKVHNILRMVVAGVFDNYFYENEIEKCNESNDERCAGSEQDAGENNNDNNK